MSLSEKIFKEKNLLGRQKSLFQDDIIDYEDKLNENISSSSFLILGGAGTIGQAVTKEIFKRNPLKLHVIDINENNLTELVRDIRASYGYIKGEFKVYSIDIGSEIYDSFIDQNNKYDYVLNLSALKHVRSEKDPFTLMRMLKVNVLNTEKTINQSITKGTKKYFTVSTDKATNPVNLMGASKRAMEMTAFSLAEDINISTARFANVLFSDGSLPFSFKQRIIKKQPIVAPYDIYRYFITPEESGHLCLLSLILGQNREIFFPKLTEKLKPQSFKDLAVNFLFNLGYEAEILDSEKEARDYAKVMHNDKKWPCYFSSSDTTGEKPIEEFYDENDTMELLKFNSVGIIKSPFASFDSLTFKRKLLEYSKNDIWERNHLVELIKEFVPELNYVDKEKFLDEKM
jgi:FlaA1/EpsC-like NDP-sugar epimerase